MIDIVSRLYIALEMSSAVHCGIQHLTKCALILANVVVMRRFHAQYGENVYSIHTEHCRRSKCYLIKKKKKSTNILISGNIVFLQFSFFRPPAPFYRNVLHWKPIEFLGFRTFSQFFSLLQSPPSVFPFLCLPPCVRADSCPPSLRSILE